jgi:hypothetical protein
MKKPKYIPALIGIPLLLYLIISACINENRIAKSILENKYETIGKVTKFYSNRSNTRYYYIYYYNNKKYNSSQNVDGENREECIGKYYKIDLSTENPQYSIIYLNQEINDSATISNAELFKPFKE